MKALSLSLPNPNSTQPSITISPPSGIPTGGLSDKGSSVVNLAIQFIFVSAIALSIIFIMLSGIEWITSGGDEKKIEKARGRLIYSIVGLVVILGSFFIISSVITLLGGNTSFFLNLTR